VLYLLLVARLSQSRLSDGIEPIDPTPLTSLVHDCTRPKTDRLPGLLTRQAVIHDIVGDLFNRLLSAMGVLVLIELGLVDVNRVGGVEVGRELVLGGHCG